MTVIAKQADQYNCRKLAYYNKYWYVSALGKNFQPPDMINNDAIVGHVAEVRINLF